MKRDTGKLIKAIRQHLRDEAGYAAGTEDARKIYRAVCSAIEECILDGDDVYIYNVGHTYETRISGRSYKNFGKDPIYIPEHNTVRFHFYPQFKRRVKDNVPVE